jgi:1,4-alpha-glucan branching enzyme
MKRLLIHIGFCLISLVSLGQEIDCRMENGQVYLTIGLNTEKPVLDSVLNSLDVGQGFADSLSAGKVKPSIRTKKWIVYSLDTRYLSLKTSLDKYAPDKPKSGIPAFELFMVESLFSKKKSSYTNEHYGFNRFAKYKKREEEGTVLFFLPNHLDAKEVFLGGTFNHWDYEKNPMEKTDSGWVVSLGLKPGMHLYKFVTDGYWELDPLNKEVLGDFMGNENSAVYVTNKTFELQGFEKAQKVYVAGSFNEWAEKDIRMERQEGVWTANVYVPEGTHGYKYIVDGNWMLDPQNPIVRNDGMGHENSFLAIGDTFSFELSGFKAAREVYVSGDFNGWQQKELAMEKTAEGWRLPYVLGQGNYQYRFLVDGNWTVDPANPKIAYEDGRKNSLLVIQPNHTFRFPHRTNVDEVVLVGTFTDWEQGSYPLLQKDKEWQVELYLPPGKHLYKYIVDGQWMVDPTNALFEQNQFNTGNSVLWIEEE